MNDHEDTMDLLTAASIDDDARRPARRGWLFASAGCVALGALVVAGSVLAASLSPAAPATGSIEPSPAVPPNVVPAPTEGTVVADQRAGIADLADAQAASELAVRTGVPERALRAYLGAALHVSADDPGCGLGWNTLAGIGAVESDHGTFGGSHVDGHGLTTPAIIGMTLDGGDTAAISDTDDGALDGDQVWDRAVGPMQFIPGTWAQWGADGNHDGVADPQNIDDSALAAARYLCAAGGDLTDPQGWITAIAAYNDAVEYNNLVADAATAYANASG